MGYQIVDGMERVAQALEKISGNARIDQTFEALIDGTNTTKLFHQWWPISGEGTDNRYQRLDRWFSLMARAWSGKFYTLRGPDYRENTTGITELTPMGDLASKSAAGCYTETSENVSEWCDEDPMTWYVRANALSLADGTMDILAVEGVDNNFDITGYTAPVYTFSMALWKLHYTDGIYEYKSFATQKNGGMRPWACDVAPDGSKRNMTWHATFTGSLITKNDKTCLTSGAGNRLAISVSGSTGIGYARNMGAYEGLYSDTDLEWLLDMWQMRHFNLENSGILEGCTNYYLRYTVAIGEENTTSVLVTAAQGANLLIGSAIDIGTSEYGGQIARGSILRKENETIDGTEYTRVYIDAADAFTTAAGNNVCTLPWFPGSTERLPGHKDGSLYNCTNGKTPARIAGVEVLDGAYTVGLDPLWNSDYNEERSPKCIYSVYACLDSEKQAASITSNYKNMGTFSSENSEWQYEKHFQIRNDGMMIPDALGGSSTTFLKSAFYFSATSGVRAPWRFCTLNRAGYAGLAGADGHHAPTIAGWDGRPRLSGSGKKRGEWAA